MASIKGETSGSGGVIAWRVALGFFSFALVMNALTSAGADRWMPVSWQWAGLPAVVVFTVITYGVLQGLATALLHLLALIVEFIERLAGAAQSITEQILTALIEHAADIAVMLARLPALPFIFAWRVFHRKFLAAAAERRRQHEELKKLYEQMCGAYSSYDEFLSDFERGARSDEPKEKPKAKPEHPKPQPPDPFAEACKLLGLPPDGSFTPEDLKRRYGAMMKSVHPDVAGANGVAAQVNHARDLIRKRKGWQ